MGLEKQCTALLGFTRTNEMRMRLRDKTNELPLMHVRRNKRKQDGDAMNVSAKRLKHVDSLNQCGWVPRLFGSTLKQTTSTQDTDISVLKQRTSFGSQRAMEFMVWSVWSGYES